MVKKASSYKWFIWVTLLFAYLIVIFHRWSFGVIEDNLSSSFCMSATAFAGIGSMYFYAYAFMQIPSGMLADSLGARFTVTVGMLLAGTSSFLFGCSSSIFYIFAGRFLVGIGVSVVFISILKILSKWYEEKKFGTMTGLTSFIGNIGGILTQSPFVIILSLISWRIAFIMIGTITLLIAFLCFVIFRNDPEDIGICLVKNKKRKLEKRIKSGLRKP
ncbi:MAG: MFS transporter [Firmicutes bacterium]|nr:MFS transporter [Bacillota bacterium]